MIQPRLRVLKAAPIMIRLVAPPQLARAEVSKDPAKQCLRPCTGTRAESTLWSTARQQATSEEERPS